jgi:uncharacterized protein DUF2188
MSKRQHQRNVRARLYVVPRAPGWTIVGAPASAVRPEYDTQQKALAAARKLIKSNEGGEIVIHGRDGRVREVDTYVLGGDGFDRISGVEGIFLSGEMERDFRRLDSKRLSPQERREWLIAKYGARRDHVRRSK